MIYVCPFCNGKGNLLIDKVILDHHRRFVMVPGLEHKVYLSPAPFAMMQVMVRRMPNPATKDSLMRAMWGDREPSSPDTVIKTQICYMRRRIVCLGLVIHTFSQIGYGLAYATPEATEVANAA